MAKRVTCHSLRYSFPTHRLESGYEIRAVQELLGHRDVSTTLMNTHVLNRERLGGWSRCTFWDRRGTVLWSS